MSKISLTPNALGTGTLTIAAPNTSTNRTLTLPDETGTFLVGTQPAGDIVGTTATQTLTNKDIVATQLTGDVAAARITTALNASGSAPIYACRAWVNFNGTGTPAIREDGNVSSITDNGEGDYTVNFTTAMPDANYAWAGSTQDYVLREVAPRSAGSVRVRNFYATSTGGGQAFSDTEYVGVEVFR
jgi:hypothetical protein